ncbi:hypothetical protein AAC387_Pa03g1818 [Persea americana]
MVHLAVHLPREAILAGPVQYRWIYPIERFLGTQKGYVTNRARPEGSIADAFITKESVNFMKMYLKGEVPEEWNDDEGERSPELGVFTQRVWPFSRITRAPNVCDRECNMAHWFVLYNTPEVIPYLEEHKRQVNEPGGCNITNL